MLYLFSFCFATFYLWNNYTVKHSFKKSSYRSCLLLCFFKSIIQALSCLLKFPILFIFNGKKKCSLQDVANFPSFNLMY